MANIVLMRLIVYLIV